MGGTGGGVHLSTKDLTAYLSKRTPMNPAIKLKNIRQVDPWATIIFFFSFPLFISYFWLENIEEYFPSIAPSVLISLTIVATNLLVLGYGIIRWGRIRWAELYLTKKDLWILFWGIVIMFWAFGLAVGPEGLNSNTFNRIKGLTGWQYCFAIIDTILIRPCLEEAYFRRFILEVFRNLYSFSVALSLTLLVATIFHLGGSWVFLFWVIFDQLLFSIVYLKGGLGSSIILHVITNAMVIGLAR